MCGLFAPLDNVPFEDEPYRDTSYIYTPFHSLSTHCTFVFILPTDFTNFPPDERVVKDIFGSVWVFCMHCDGVHKHGQMVQLL